MGLCLCGWVQGTLWKDFVQQEAELLCGAMLSGVLFGARAIVTGGGFSTWFPVFAPFMM